MRAAAVQGGKTTPSAATEVNTEDIEKYKPRLRVNNPLWLRLPQLLRGAGHLCNNTVLLWGSKYEYREQRKQYHVLRRCYNM